MFQPVKLQVTEKQQALLRQLSQSRSESYRIVERAQLIVQIVALGNPSNLKVQLAFGNREAWVKKWRKRWFVRQAGLAQQEATLSEKAYRQAIRQALEDDERSGAPPTFSVEQQCRLYELACQSPQESGYPLSHWDSKTLRLELLKRGIVPDISVSTVTRFLKKKGTAGRPR
jgi:putative transposase